MKTLKLIALAASAFLFSQCKTTAPTAPTGPAPSLLQVAQILDTTQKKFLQFADSTNGNPWKAIMLTAAWVKTQPNVQAVEALDSTYINILLKSGLQTTFSFDQLDANGHSLFKGGGGSGKSKNPTLSRNGVLSKNMITNKKVLLYLACFSQFYTDAQIQKILYYFTNSGLGLDVTVLKDAQCTYQTVESFKDYGLVIIDTHGGPDGFRTGSFFSIIPNVPVSDDLLKGIIVSQLGQDCYDKIISGRLRYSASQGIYIGIPGWQKQVIGYTVPLVVTTKYLEDLSDMPGTVVFGNMCFSGQSSSTFNGNPPIEDAFSNLIPITYYGFAHDDGTSASVDVDFSNAMLDTFVRALVINNDSTGSAYLKADGTEFSDYTILPPFASLYLKHFGANNYSYLDCIKQFTDARDGHVYKAVCIGNQTWMAENLAYDAPGSLCYNNDAANCKIYGKLYDYTTLMQGYPPSNKVPSGARGVCPYGWHVPSDSEFRILVKFLGGTDFGGGAVAGFMKSTSPLWNSPNAGATNSSGFSALPAGDGSGGTFFQNIGTLAEFNTSTATIAPTYIAPSAYLLSSSSNVIQPGVLGDGARSCRCVKDP